MAKTTETKVISMGICSFCKGEFESTKMTQHLKYCKQRAIEIAAGTQSATKAQKTKLFHIVVEGQYNPQYWMHLEMPVTDTMANLDSFLRDTWVECCNHLSAFRVGNTNYSLIRKTSITLGTMRIVKMRKTRKKMAMSRKTCLPISRLSFWSPYLLSC